MWKPIFKTTLLAGSLDITAACVNAYISNNIMPGRVLQYIASGIYGKDAYAGGYGIMAIGLVSHFVIAFACTYIFFMLYPRFPFLRKNIFVNSGLIALIAWFVTTYIIIPFSRIHPGKFHLDKSLLAIAILFFCIGLPVSWFAKKYYAQNPGSN